MAVNTLINDSQEINRFFLNLSREGSTGIIRPIDAPTLGVKFKFGKTRLKEHPIALQLIGISTYGLEKLKEYKDLKIEVFGQDKRVSFEARTLKVGNNGIWVSLPHEVINSERRERQRYITNDSHTPFFDPGGWTINPDDITAPPLFSLYKPISTWCRIMDISFDGICFETRFPAIIGWVEKNPIFKDSRIILPMKRPYAVPTELRWTKRIRERVRVEDNTFISIQKYKFGVKYQDPKREFLREVAEFLKIMQVTKSPEGIKGVADG